MKGWWQTSEHDNCCRGKQRIWQMAGFPMLQKGGSERSMYFLCTTVSFFAATNASIRSFVGALQIIDSCP